MRCNRNLLIPKSQIHRDRFSVNMEAVLLAIIKGMGKEALSMTVEEIQSACDEIKAAIEHNLDERDYINMGLDAWKIIRNLYKAV